MAVKISCDKCEKDLTTVHSGLDCHKFHLTRSLIPNTEMLRYALHVIDTFPGEMVFCSLQCLFDWLKEHLHVEK